MNGDEVPACTGIGLMAETAPCLPDDRADLDEVFGRFLRLYVAEGDVSPATISIYHAQAAQFVAWCRRESIRPETATEKEIIAYRKYLIDEGYKQATVTLKLAAVRRVYEVIRWRGLRGDDPAAGVKAPRDRVARDA